MSNSTEIVKIALEGTKTGAISVSNISEPYGAGSDDVVSIGVALDGENVEWKAHIPYGNIDAVIEALNKAKEQKA
jgi:hypothetical protein